ncbi:MAG TPA: NAD-dependent epimerase/dehydratase family protein [Anaerolineae bacterium]|nr:NAD-dependent epimerase/dehydratase family protein [Anaerolineae bacterium]
MRIFITGVNSFLGAHLARQLLAQGHQVRGLLRAGSNDVLLQKLPGVERVVGDLLQPETWRRALAECDVLFHVAASYTHDPAHIPHMEAVNIEGTRLVLEAALEAGVTRIVHTSTIGTIGQSEDGSLATEETPFNLPNPSAYVLSKRAGETIALALAGRGAPIVVVHPTAMLGPGDWRPTASGQKVLAFLHDRPFSYPPGGINWVPVEDVAAGMILAMERGTPGRRYILGHREGNLSRQAFIDLLARASGKPVPRPARPSWKGRLRGWLKPLRPTSSVQGTAPQRLTCDPARAIEELGMPQSDLLAAARRAIAWYRKMGMW